MGKLLTAARVAEKIGISVRSVWRLKAEDASFPKPVPLIIRRVLWRESDIAAYLARADRHDQSKRREAVHA